MTTEGTLAWPLERAVLVRGDREAVVGDGVRRSWRETAARVARLGAGLEALGVRRDARVAVLAANHVRYLELHLAVPRVGAVLNALNVRLAPAELEFIVEDSTPEILFVDDAHFAVGRRIEETCSSVRTLVYMGDGSAPEGTIPFEDLLTRGEAPPADVRGEQLATISYTGGTTGRPKGVMLSHANLLANAKHLMAALPPQPDDRYLHAAPMFHAADAMMIFGLTWVGATHVVVPGFDPALVPAVVEAEHVTMTVLVPTMVNMLLADPGIATRDLSSLRLVMYGASPMPEHLLQRAMKTIPCDWAQLYGMTEAAPIVTVLSPDEHRHGVALRSAGTPVPGVQAEVRRPDGSRCAPGEPGEILVRGPNVMLGYWNRPDETAAAFDGGWYRSGDLAYSDEGGHLFIVDRAKDMIITGGENVYSSEVENVLYGHPAVAEAVVFGIPDDEWGERVHAVVVLRDGEPVAEDELREHCRGELAGYKLPRSIELRREALPKSGAGKILKRELRAPYWEGQSRRV